MHSHSLTHRLDGLPEIERESILASRQEEMHQYKESLQIAAMYKMTMDQEGDDDDSPRGKRQSEYNKWWTGWSLDSVLAAESDFV
jgi:hypothetical protein